MSITRRPGELTPLKQRVRTIAVGAADPSQRLVPVGTRQLSFPLDPDTQVAWRFDRTKDLVDEVRGLTLDFVRSSIGTYVGADRLIKTALANEARFDHDPVTGESLGLLIEEARTNACLHSQDFTQSSSWVAESSTSDPVITADDAVAPDGTLTADRFDFPPVSGSESSVLRQVIIQQVDHVNTVYMKAATPGDVGKTVLLYSAQAGVNTPHVLTTDWRRVEYVHTWTGSNNRVSIAALGSVFTGGVDQGAASAHIWGAQYEAAAFPTSYIPTGAVTETRAAEEALTTDVSWLTPGVGTWYAHLEPLGTPGSSEYGVVTDGTTLPARVMVGQSGDWRSLDQSVVLIFGSNLFQAGVRAKGALAYSDISAQKAGSVNGNAVVTNAYATVVFDLPQLSIGRRGGNRSNMHVREIGYANVRKDDAFLQDITEL